jgi:hypothetical protein
MRLVGDAVDIERGLETRQLVAVFAIATYSELLGVAQEMQRRHLHQFVVFLMERLLALSRGIVKAFAIAVVEGCWRFDYVEQVLVEGSDNASH